MLVTNQVVQKLVEDRGHGVGENLPVLHAFLGGTEKGRRGERGGGGREGVREGVKHNTKSHT